MASERESVDVCVVGSGAGGAVVAYECAKRGLSTLVLERGPRVTPRDFSYDELQMIPQLYKDGGLQLNTSMDLFILQGTCVGGSTLLSNMVMLKPDASIFDAWERYGGEVNRDQLDRYFDEVTSELDVRFPEARNVSVTSKRFYEGARSLGLQPQLMQKALGDCKGCGYCNVGCSFGTKQDTSRSYLRWAEDLGARVISEAEVTSIQTSRGVARSVAAEVGRRRRPLHVDAKTVVVAAGAIGSSAVLLRSGIRRNVGKRLSFNAGGMLVAEFDEPVDGFDGDQMTIYLQGEGYVIEATHNPPMSAALTTPGWFEQHGELMKHSRNLAYAGPLVATEPVGEVVMSPFFGHEETRFHITPRDLSTLKRGLRTASEIFFAAGAKRIMLPTHKFHAFRSPQELDRIDSAFTTSRELAIGSAHPQGGNPMSSDPRLGAVGTDLRVHGFDNLFVADASVFPSCIGVNPIHTIMALAKHASAHITAQA